MKSHLKKMIKTAFEAPKPDYRKKEELLRMLPQPTISVWKFILIQASYIRKRTLFLSIILLFPALKGANILHRLSGVNSTRLLPVLNGANSIRTGDLWLISAFIPFLALLAVVESKRSTTYGMDEFEMAARFSLKSIMLARMSVLGLLDAFILCCFVPLCYMNSSLSLIQTGVYILTPYLLTVNISLWITRHFHGREVIYACVSAAVMVSGANIVLCTKPDYIYQFYYLKWWLIFAVLLALGMIYETYRTVKQTEELVWNL